MSERPIFAVVGHPNKGKSSVVAALTLQDGVAISEISGTTTESQSFTLKINGELLYTLVDTPGFQRPRQMLEQLTKIERNASERLVAIRDFISTHQNKPNEHNRFKDEIELLTPILNGASIIYVVDGSVPYGVEYEAEMTILQWTGSARMALINPINGDAYLEEWLHALNQFFSLVQVFNPMNQQSQQQQNILSSFAVLDPTRKIQIEHAQSVLSNHKLTVKKQSAYLIATYLQKAISQIFTSPLPSDALLESIQPALKARYTSKQKSLESLLVEDLKQCHSHSSLTTEVDPLVFDFPDLFDQNHWYLFGLSRSKLISLSAAAGAATGALVDLSVGGTSLMTGSILGGITSGAAAAWLSAAPEKTRIVNLPLGGKQLQIGPIDNIQFSFVILGRAIAYQHAISKHTHANRLPLQVVDKPPTWVDSLSKHQQIRAMQLLKKASKGLSPNEEEKLRELIEGLVS